MTPHSPPIEQWNTCGNVATKLEVSIQETSIAYAEASRKLTGDEVGTMQKRLEQYRIWLTEGKAALDLLEKGVYKEFCESVEELLANSNDNELKAVPIDAPVKEGGNSQRSSQTEKQR